MIGYMAAGLGLNGHDRSSPISIWRWPLWHPSSSEDSSIVRGLDESVKRRLAEQAEEHGHSMEAEILEILTRASSRPHIGLELLEAARSNDGVEELRIPERVGEAREVDFE